MANVPTMRDLETKLHLRWVDVSDARATQRALIEVTPEGANLELPRGRRGEKGEKGDPGPGLWWRYSITDRSELPKDLTRQDAGAAFPDVVSRSLWVWDGEDFMEVQDFVGVQGRPGETPRFQVGSVEPGQEARVSVNQAASTETLVVLDFTLPQGPRGEKGEKGDPGDAGAVSEAPDVDLSVPPVDGEALTWNGAYWAPRSILAPVGPFAMGPNNFTSVSQSYSGSNQINERLIGTIDVPALPFDWRPVVAGGMVRLDTSSSVRFDAQVRVGDPQQGDMVALGRGDRGSSLREPVIIVPFFEPGATPASSHGVVQAGSATTVYVSLVKEEGSYGAWEFSREHASLVFMAQPVNMDVGV